MSERALLKLLLSSELTSLLEMPSRTLYRDQFIDHPLESELVSIKNQPIMLTELQLELLMPNKTLL